MPCSTRDLKSPNCTAQVKDSANWQKAAAHEFDFICSGRFRNNRGDYFKAARTRRSNATVASFVRWTGGSASIAVRAALKACWASPSRPA